MKNNVVKVLLWGKEICRLQWQGGYREKFGKVGSLISFNPDYKSYGFDVDPLGIYNSNSLFVKKGLSALPLILALLRISALILLRIDAVFGFEAFGEV